MPWNTTLTLPHPLRRKVHEQTVAPMLRANNRKILDTSNSLLGEAVSRLNLKISAKSDVVKRFVSAFIRSFPHPCGA
jgi:hypothetical protein